MLFSKIVLTEHSNWIDKNERDPSIGRWQFDSFLRFFCSANFVDFSCFEMARDHGNLKITAERFIKSQTHTIDTLTTLGWYKLQNIWMSCMEFGPWADNRSTIELKHFFKAFLTLKPFIQLKLGNSEKYRENSLGTCTLNFLWSAWIIYIYF